MSPVKVSPGRRRQHAGADGAVAEVVAPADLAGLVVDRAQTPLARTRCSWRPPSRTRRAPA